MLTKKINQGKVFESSIEESCTDQNIFYFRVRDVNLPPDVRMRVKLPQNKYDYLIFHKEHLFPIELKSTKGKSISFSESMIKANQIRNLKEAAEYKGVIPGFLFNFREPENRVFFIHINDFLEYKNIAENGLEHAYEGRINKASIPIHICEQIGKEVISVKKRTRYRYLLNKLIQELINDYK